MSRKAHIVGVGESQYTKWGKIVDETEHALAHKAILKAVADAGLEVDDVDATYARAKAMGAEITYDITDEPWGVRRFFAHDPAGKVLNILAHVA